MENIDKILKESFEGFTPDAPNVWSNVSQQVGNHAVHQSVAGKAAAAFKSATIVTKVFILASLPVLGGVGYFVYQADKATTTQVEMPVINQSNPTEQLAPLASDQDKIKTDDQIVSSEKGTNQIQHVSKTSTNSVMDEKQQGELEPLNTLTSTVNSPNNLINNTQLNQTAITKSENNNQTKPKMFDRSERARPSTKEIATINEENDNITIPDVFTPGDIDGKNDDYKILIDNEKSYYLKVFDINDNLVFESNSKENTWDGKNYKNGQTCDEGIYSFVFIYELNNGKSGTKSGKIKLIR